MVTDSSLFPDITVSPKKVSRLYLFLKRSFDMFSSAIAILLLSIFFIIILIINSFSVKGSPIYVDERVGKNGKTIKILKFRSMYKDANTNIHKYLNDEQYEQFLKERKVDNDPRITKLGRFLRKTSIDELPQLFNIFIGQMSVVGPRPVTKQEIDNNFTKEQQLILLSARPGLTGWWQIKGRSDSVYENGERQKLELEYFQIRSLWNDFKIILKTIPSVLSKKGAK